MDCPYDFCDGSGWMEMFGDDNAHKCLCKRDKEEKDTADDDK